MFNISYLEILYFTYWTSVASTCLISHLLPALATDTFRTRLRLWQPFLCSSLFSRPWRYAMQYLRCQKIPLSLLDGPQGATGDNLFWTCYILMSVSKLLGHLSCHPRQNMAWIPILWSFWPRETSGFATKTQWCWLSSQGYGNNSALRRSPVLLIESSPKLRARDLQTEASPLLQILRPKDELVAITVSRSHRPSSLSLSDIAEDLAQRCDMKYQQISLSNDVSLESHIVLDRKTLMHLVAPPLLDLGGARKLDIMNSGSSFPLQLLLWS